MVEYDLLPCNRVGNRVGTTGGYGSAVGRITINVERGTGKGHEAGIASCSQSSVLHQWLYLCQL